MLFMLYKYYHTLLQDLSAIIAREQGLKCHAVRQCGSQFRELPRSGIASCDERLTLLVNKRKAE
jgi:hypothetical protein